MTGDCERLNHRVTGRLSFLSLVIRTRCAATVQLKFCGLTVLLRRVVEHTTVGFVNSLLDSTETWPG